MIIFEEINSSTHEKVIYFHDSESGLKTIIAIHSTVLGPSLGGCRMKEYNSKEDAISDVLRLSEGMTYKAAIAGLKLGGGKSVILANPKTDKTDKLFASFGKCINQLNGEYITAEDMGTTVKDMEIVRKETDYAAGISESLGGSGDPSDFTSYGTYVGIKAAVDFKFKQSHLNGLSIAVQGLGNVGMKLIDYLSKYDMKIYVNDVDDIKVRDCVSKYNTIPCLDSELYNLDVDIFSPCAVGAIINDLTIKHLKCSIVAGAANNILEDYDKHGQMLFNKNILYAPDYVINSGGLINIYNELYPNYNRSIIYKKVDKIFDSLIDIFDNSSRLKKPTNIVSNELASNIINNKKIELNSVEEIQ